MSVSVVVGILFEKNTFCRCFCPVGHLLGLYARLSPFGWRVKDANTCRTCTDKSCISKEHTYNPISKSCGVDLYPGNLRDNTDCILCTGCLKTCSHYNSEKVPERPNPGFRFIGFAKDFFSAKPLSNAQAVFVIIVSGFVIYEILSEWSVTKSALMFLPNMVNGYLQVTNSIISGLIESIILFIFFPLVIWFLPFLIVRMRAPSLSLSDHIKYFGLAFIPIMASAHFSKALLKTSSRIAYFEHLSLDITGMSTAQQILERTIVLQSLPTWLYLGVTVLILVLLTTGTLLSLKSISVIVQKQTGLFPGLRVYYLIPLFYGGIFLATVLCWRLNLLNL